MNGQSEQMFSPNQMFYMGIFNEKVGENSVFRYKKISKNNKKYILVEKLVCIWVEVTLS